MSKTGGRKRATTNRRTAHRRQETAEATNDATRMSVPIVRMNMVQRLRFTSDYFFTLAERERQKGDHADLGFVVAMMQLGATCAAKAAPFVHPKLAAMQLDLSKPQRTSIDLEKLSDEELNELERIVAKSQMSVRDEGEESVSRTADEY